MVGLFDTVVEFTSTKKANLDGIRGKIDTFNRAVREAHAEMIASKADSKESTIGSRRIIKADGYLAAEY